MTVEKVLVPVDGSKRSMNAVTYAAEVFPDATIAVVHVIDPTYEWSEGPGWTEEWQARASRVASTLVEEAAQLAREHGNVAESEVAWGEPYREILEFADETDADHVMMGSTGQSMTGRLLLGSVAETVVKRASIPVTLVRFGNGDREIESPRRVLIPIDGSDIAYTSLEHAVEWFPVAEHTVLYVCELDIDPEQDVSGTYLADRCRREERRAEKILETAAEYAAERDLSLRHEVRFGRAVEAITQFIEDEGFDHVVVGRRGRSRLARLAMGSVAEAVATRAPVPVTVYR